MGAMVSIAVIALAIVGLAGALAPTLAAIATIVTGAAILIEGGSWQAGALALPAGSEVHDAEFTGVPSAEALGGIAGIVLGILALLGIASETLISVAVLVYGATLLLNGLPFAQKAWFSATADGQLLLGLGATVLGLLAVIGISQLSMILVGLLVLGVAGLFGGSVRAFEAVQEKPKYSATSAVG